MKEVVKFLVESAIRFFSKSPKFIMIIQVILILLGAVSWILTNLVQDGILVPAPWVQALFVGDDSWIKFVTGVIAAQFAVENTIEKDRIVNHLIGKKD